MPALTSELKTREALINMALSRMRGALTCVNNLRAEAGLAKLTADEILEALGIER